MLSTLTLVSLGLFTTGGIEIVTVIDPTKAEIADIDAAVRDYATSPSPKALTASEAPHDYRSDKPCPPTPLVEVDEIAVPVSVAKDEFDLETLKPSTSFVVLREQERPTWVAQAPQLKGNGEHFVSVASDPWKTDFEANEALEKKLRAAVDDYINDQIGRPDAARRIRLADDEVAQLIGQRYAEELQFTDSAIGTMKQVHARLDFTPQFRAAIAERWKEHVVNSRLLRTGLTAAGVLLLLVMAFGVLKRLGRR